MSSSQSIVRREAALLLVMLMVGLLLMPMAIYVVGDAVFGSFSGSGFGEFFGTLHADLRSGEPTVAFLVLTPYLVWQILRMTVHLFRRTGSQIASS